MKTNITQLATLLFAHLIAVAVVLAHVHIGDVIRHSSSDHASYTVRTSADVNVKALGDLHNHIDKTALKNIMKSAGDSTAATRRRDLRDALLDNDENIFDRFYAGLLFLRVALTLRT